MNMLKASVSGRSSTDQLYGLRAVTAALLVASHCYFLGQGGLSVAIMFCLSGFLAVRPFSTNDVHFRSVIDILKYYLKKLINLYPSYFVIIVGVKFLTDNYFWGSWRQVLRLLVFAEAPGHLWYLQDTMVIYLFTPLIVIIFDLITFWIKGNKRYLVLAGLSIILVYVSMHFITKIVVFHTASGDRAWSLYKYVLGMVFGYLYHYLKNTKWVTSVLIPHKASKIIINIVTIVLVALMFVSSNAVLYRFNIAYATYYVGWSKPILCGTLTGVLVILLLLYSDSLVSRLFRTKFFVFLGKISFETYLLHWYLLSFLRITVHTYKNFLLIYFYTVCASWFIHQIGVWISKKTAFIFTKK